MYGGALIQNEILVGLFMRHAPLSTCDETNSSRAICSECKEGVVGFDL